MHNSSVIPHKRPSPCPVVVNHGLFANIVSSMELFSISKFVLHAEECDGINMHCTDILMTSKGKSFVAALLPYSVNFAQNLSCFLILPCHQHAMFGWTATHYSCQWKMLKCQDVHGSPRNIHSNLGI